MKIPEHSNVSQGFRSERHDSFISSCLFRGVPSFRYAWELGTTDFVLSALHVGMNKYAGQLLGTMKCRGQFGWRFSKKFS